MIFGQPTTATSEITGGWVGGGGGGGGEINKKGGSGFQFWGSACPFSTIILKTVSPIRFVPISSSILHQSIKEMALRKSRITDFHSFQVLVICLTLVFDLHKLPYRKPITQQPFNNYSSILCSHSFRTNKKRNFDLPPKQDQTFRRND